MFLLHCHLFCLLSASWPYGGWVVCLMTQKDSFVSRCANCIVQCNFHCPQPRGSSLLQVRAQEFISVRSEDSAFPLHIQVGFINLVLFLTFLLPLFQFFPVPCSKKLKYSTTTATPQYFHCSIFSAHLPTEA